MPHTQAGALSLSLVSIPLLAFVLSTLTFTVEEPQVCEYTLFFLIPSDRVKDLKAGQSFDCKQIFF